MIQMYESEMGKTLNFPVRIDGKRQDLSGATCTLEVPGNVVGSFNLMLHPTTRGLAYYITQEGDFASGRYRASFVYEKDQQRLKDEFELLVLAG